MVLTGVKELGNVSKHGHYYEMPHLMYNMIMVFPCKSSTLLIVSAETNSSLKDCLKV
jgi:hypothetical protein